VRWAERIKWLVLGVPITLGLAVAVYLFHWIWLFVPGVLLLLYLLSSAYLAAPNVRAAGESGPFLTSREVSRFRELATRPAADLSRKEARELVTLATAPRVRWKRHRDSVSYRILAFWSLALWIVLTILVVWIRYGAPYPDGWALYSETVTTLDPGGYGVADWLQIAVPAIPAAALYLFGGRVLPVGHSPCPEPPQVSLDQLDRTGRA